MIPADCDCAFGDCPRPAGTPCQHESFIAARTACDDCDRILGTVKDRSDPVWSRGEEWLCDDCADAACEAQAERRVEA